MMSCLRKVDPRTLISNFPLMLLTNRTILRFYRPWSKGDIPLAIDAARSHFFSNQKILTTNKKGRATLKVGLSLDGALEAVRRNSKDKDAKMDEIVSSHLDHNVVIALHCDLPKEHLNGIRATVRFPHPLIKESLKTCVFAPPELKDKAMKAGATFVGGSELIEEIISGKIKFNRCIATPDMMPVVAKLARFLGPQGLVPTIKSGTH